MRTFKLGLFGALAFIACIIAAYALSTSVTIQNVGRVKAVGVGVYWDTACSNAVTQINWGMVEPGSNKSVVVYIRNEGNTVAKLSYITESWSPSEASQFLELTWDYSNQWLAPNAAIPVTLTLTVSPNIQGIDNFSFNIIISAVG